MATINSVLSRKRRGTVNPKKIACFCDISDADALASCEAYYDAYGDMDKSLIFQVDLSLAANTTISLVYDAWFKDWVEMLEDNNVEMICCSPQLPRTLQERFSGTDFGNVNTISLLSILARSMVAHVAMKAADDLRFVYTYFSSPNLYSPLTLNPDPEYGIMLGYSIASYCGVGNFNLQLQFPVPRFTDVPEVMTDVKGNDLREYTETGTVDLRGSTAFSGTSHWICFQFDFMRTFNNVRWQFVPYFRIGWYGSQQLPKPTVTEITNLVNRNKSIDNTFEANKDKPVVIHPQARTGSLQANSSLAAYVIAESKGCTNLKLGYGNHGATYNQMLAFRNKLTDREEFHPDETVNSAIKFIANDDTVAASVDTFRDLQSQYNPASGNYDATFWHAFNGQTFPIDTFISIGGAFINMGTSQNDGSWCDGGANAVFNPMDGSIKCEMTSHGLSGDGWFIKNGGGAVVGSYIEPNATNANQGSNLLANLLQGYDVATASFFTNHSQQFVEVWGDGRLAPYASEATEMARNNKFRFQQTAVEAFTTTLLTIANAGANHAANDIVTFSSDTGGGQGARIRVDTVTGGAIATFTLVSGGVGFDKIDSMYQTSTTGSGTGARFFVGINISSGGGSHAVNDIVEFKAANDSITEVYVQVLAVSSGAITDLQVLSSGTGAALSGTISQEGTDGSGTGAVLGVATGNPLAVGYFNDAIVEEADERFPFRIFNNNSTELLVSSMEDTLPDIVGLVSWLGGNSFGNNEDRLHFYWVDPSPDPIVWPFGSAVTLYVNGVAYPVPADQITLSNVSLPEFITAAWPENATPPPPAIVRGDKLSLEIDTNALFGSGGGGKSVARGYSPKSSVRPRIQRGRVRR